MAENAEGRRVKMTKALLKSSLIELMKTKSIHTISIKEICTGADINRSTFYRHYNTQYDLYDEIVHELLASLIEAYTKSRANGEDLQESIAAVLEVSEKEREVCLVILSDKGNVTMGESFVKAISPVVTDDMNELSVYLFQFMAAGLANIVWTWLNKPVRQSPHELASLMYSMMKRGIYKTIIRQAAKEGKLKDLKF
ncbi:MAG: TetR/AcrR family transcriptional regulator [Clostridia bacterium]|nr:TetR/AcrR family transcriptional regulator [Clostridia bacterium]